MTRLCVLVVDDERPALDELGYLLGRDPRVGEVLACQDPAEALRVLDERDVDLVLLDVQMPGLGGIELAHTIGALARPPALVFVTAHEQHAVAAFELDAVDYLLKPVREERLAESLRRVVAGGARPGEVPEEQVAVERAGVTRFVNRSEIRYVEAHGDYVRLHTATESHLLRAPLTTLTTEWADAGFVRVHRSLLVCLPHVQELRVEAGRCAVVVDGAELPVSRRHAPQLRELLARRGRP